MSSADHTRSQWRTCLWCTLRERIAKALWDDLQDREWDDTLELHRENYRRKADRVLAVLHEAEEQEDERSEFLAKCPCCKGKRMPCDLCDGFRTVVIRSAGVLDHRVQGSRDRLFIPIDPSPAVAGEQDGDPMDDPAWRELWHAANAMWAHREEFDVQRWTRLGDALRAAHAGEQESDQ